MEKGILYGVSVGPGDPELLTLRAVRVLEGADCIAAPDVGGSSRTALRIAGRYIQGKPLIDCRTPMTTDRNRTERAYDAIAKNLAALLDEGKSVAYLTLGDAAVYSTWSYVCSRMEARGYAIEVVPGVPSFCAAAAVLRTSLCERSGQLLIAPVATGDAVAALEVPGTKVFMKAGRHVGELRDALAERGLAGSASLVSNCGLPGQVVVRNLETARKLPGYLSVVIVKDAAAPGSGALPPASEAGAAAVPVRHPQLVEWESHMAAPSDKARQQAVDIWNAVAKPIGGLGVLEDDVVRIAALTGSARVSIDKRAVVVFCADNGVVAEGVSQCGQEVTAAVASNIARGVSSVCQMAATARMEVFAVDVGMASPPAPGIEDRCVARGTGNIAAGPAMTPGQALQAIRAGIDTAARLARQGYRLIAAGEMGIGNTSTASAMASVLLDMPAARVTGRGAGLSNAGLRRKVDAIERAIAVNRPNPSDTLDVLAKLGGFDIAALAGLFLGGAMQRVPVVVDGYISALAAYVASLLCPSCTCAMLASHVSAEPASGLLLERLGLQPAIQAGLRLGEGTGAVCLVPLLDAALALYRGATFEETGIAAYEANPQG